MRKHLVIIFVNICFDNQHIMTVHAQCSTTPKESSTGEKLWRYNSSYLHQFQMSTKPHGKAHILGLHPLHTKKCLSYLHPLEILSLSYLHRRFELPSSPFKLSMLLIYPMKQINVILRMYCIDRALVPENNVLCTYCSTSLNPIFWGPPFQTCFRHFKMWWR